MSKIDGGLRILFRECIPHFDWQPIETAATGGGVPDSNFCHKGIEGWVEFKRTPGWTVPLRPAQVGWIARRTRAGGRVWIAVRQQGPGRDTLWLIPGLLAKEAKAGGLREMANYTWDVATCEGGPRVWDWRAIAEFLTTVRP